MKAGTFEPYPSYSSDPYIKNPATRVTGEEKKRIFVPPAVPKSRPTESIVGLNVVRSVSRIRELIDWSVDGMLCV